MKLAPRHAPYWQELERGLAIGYHRATRGGTWRMRERVGDAYRKSYLGRADDLTDADGRKILSFSDAVRLILAEERPTRAPSSDLTVDQAIDEYLEAKKVRSSSHDVLRERIAADRLIIPVLGSRRLSQLSEEERYRLRHSLHGKRVSELTTADLRRWRDSRVRPMIAKNVVVPRTRQTESGRFCARPSTSRSRMSEPRLTRRGDASRRSRTLTGRKLASYLRTTAVG